MILPRGGSSCDQRIRLKVTQISAWDQAMQAAAGGDGGDGGDGGGLEIVTDDDM